MGSKVSSTGLERHHGDLGAQGAQHAGQLDADVAAADDADRLGCSLQLEEAVGGDAELGAGHTRHDRPPAGGDGDVVGGVALAVDLDGVGIDEAGAPWMWVMPSPAT
jgi:hypothetical protein